MSPFSLSSPVCASETGWWPLEAAGRSSREKCALPSWLASSFWRLLKFTLWFSGSLKKEKKKSYLCRSPDRTTSDRQQKASLQSHQQLFQVSLLLHLSIPPLHLPAAFILFLILLIIMICIQQKRLIQAGIRLRAGRWARVLGGFWVV